MLNIPHICPVLLQVIFQAGKKLTTSGIKTTVPHKFSLSPQILFFCELKPHAKFQNPRTSHSRRKLTQGGRKKDEEKTRKNASNRGLLPATH